MQSLQGQILIASARLMDPNFARTVLLMVQHGEDGALGLVLNHPSETSVKDACADVLEEPCQVDDVMYHGGPCEGPLMVLHAHETASDTTVLPGVFFTTSRDQIAWLLLHANRATRYFIGYASWTAGQLEQELELGSWLTLPAEQKQIFSTDPNQWSRLIQQATMGKWIDTDKLPEDPSVN